MEKEADEKVNASNFVSFERKDVNPPELNIQSEVRIFFAHLFYYLIFVLFKEVNVLKNYIFYKIIMFLY